MKSPALFLLAFLGACRGQTSGEPPVQLLQNIYFQSNFKPQKENRFFEDTRGNRPLEPGTVARGFLRDDPGYWEGRTPEGAYVLDMPSRVKLTRELVLHGKDRYEVFCTPCHGQSGLGNGTASKFGMLPPANFHLERFTQMPAGQIYESIHKGVRGNMPSYAHALEVDERWAVVSYVRALQRSKRARIDQVPEQIREDKGWK